MTNNKLILKNSHKINVSFGVCKGKWGQMPETDVNFPGGEELSKVNQVFAREKMLARLFPYLKQYLKNKPTMTCKMKGERIRRRR